MKQLTAGAGSGCLVWVLTFGILSTCLCPVGLFGGSLTAVTNADAVVRLIGPQLCPAGSTGKVETYNTTTTDDFGNSLPATGYTMVCQDANGVVVSSPGPTYAFVWVGILAAVALVLAAVLAIFLAAPAGALVAGWLGRRKQAAGGAGMV